MKRPTHIMLGAAVAMPIAVSLSPGLALGAVWFGMAGGGFPDWLDLRSELRSPLRLRHRGASHGLPLGILLTIGVWIALRAASATTIDLGSLALHVPADAIQPWTIAFGLGFLSHLLSDAWTVAGIRPLLPIASFRFWIVPKVLRGRSSGPLDFLARFVAMCGILAGVVAYAMVHV
ncbi:MAG TPA: metal-dependent hydrolase [Thermomicrobiales bacterium]|nr:metal-dependent hydrolase [Thermomicrobiales bacterium]